MNLIPPRRGCGENGRIPEPCGRWVWQESVIVQMSEQDEVEDLHLIS